MRFDITAPNLVLQSAILHKINHKTKPLGSLGLLESLALQLGLIQQSITPTLNNPTMLVFAGDHGIAHEGVSPYPQAVTAQMVLNFLQGGAAINVFAKQNNMQLRIVDSGVNTHFLPHVDLIDAKVGMGTHNFLHQAAMSVTQCEVAIQRGAQIVNDEMTQGCNVFGFGEMGISNTSSASCLMSVLCNLPLAVCIGRGTGLDDAGLVHKQKVLSAALAHHKQKSEDVLKVLATFGGFEITMMVGAMLQAATKNCVLLIDGFITSAALLVATKIQPNILHYCVFSHCSDESGHQKMLSYLNAKPLLNIGLRLGEGTGAALAYPLVLAAANFLNEMASFESAQVLQKTS